LLCIVFETRVNASETFKAKLTLWDFFSSPGDVAAVEEALWAEVLSGFSVLHFVIRLLYRLVVHRLSVPLLLLLDSLEQVGLSRFFHVLVLDHVVVLARL